MQTDPISRRAFFGQAAAAPAAGVLGAHAPPPKTAWTIVALNWEYDDESNYTEGERALGCLYHDKDAAEAECRKLNAQFFREEDPDLFAPEHYLPDFDHSETGGDPALQEALWARMVEGGFPDPYSVLELTQPRSGEEPR